MADAESSLVLIKPIFRDMRWDGAFLYITHTTHFAKPIYDKLSYLNGG